MTAALVLAMLSTLMTACASVALTPASPGLARQARSLSPPPGKANVSVIRGEGHLGAESYLY